MDIIESYPGTSLFVLAIIGSVVVYLTVWASRQSTSRAYLTMTAQGEADFDRVPSLYPTIHAPYPPADPKYHLLLDKEAVELGGKTKAMSERTVFAPNHTPFIASNVPPYVSQEEEEAPTYGPLYPYPDDRHEPFRYARSLEYVNDFQTRDFLAQLQLPTTY